MKIYKMLYLQSNVVGGSCRMEKAGLVESVSFFQSQGLTIGEIVTDRHPMIVKHIREQMKDTKHSFDVWHVAKGLSFFILSCTLLVWFSCTLPSLRLSYHWSHSLTFTHIKVKFFFFCSSFNIRFAFHVACHQWSMVKIKLDHYSVHVRHHYAFGHLWKVASSVLWSWLPYWRTTLHFNHIGAKNSACTPPMSFATIMIMLQYYFIDYFK